MNSLHYLIDIYQKYCGAKASVILEIGSRDGNDAAYLSSLLFSDHVYTFEANIKCHQLIRQSYPNFNNIYGAVSNYKGLAFFNIVNSNDWDAVGTSSLRDRTDSWYEGKAEKVQVPVNRIDNLIKKYSIVTPMDLVKVDVEGCSFEAIEGFGKYLNDVKVFHVENETYPYWKDQKLSDDVGALLSDNGFTLVHSEQFGTNSVDEVWINDGIL